MYETRLDTQEVYKFLSTWPWLYFIVRAVRYLNNVVDFYRILNNVKNVTSFQANALNIITFILAFFWLIRKFILGFIFLIIGQILNTGIISVRVISFYNFDLQSMPQLLIRFYFVIVSLSTARQCLQHTLELEMHLPVSSIH